MERENQVRGQIFCQTRGDRTSLWWGLINLFYSRGLFLSIRCYFAIVVFSILAALQHARKTLNAGSFICRKKALRSTTWKAYNLEMFKSLHSNKKWKWCQVCAKRKDVIAMCFLPQPSWAKKHNQPSRLQSCHLWHLADSAAYPTRLSSPRNITQTLQHKCSFLQVRALQQSWISSFICPKLCCQIAVSLLTF